MKARSVLLAVLSLALVSLACQPPAAEVGQLSEADEAAIQAVVDDLMEAELAGDWEAMYATFTEDVVAMLANHPALEGLAAYREWIEPLDVSVSELSVAVAEIDGRGDLAYVRGTYSETYTVGEAEPIEEQGKYLFILKKHADGSWRMAITISNSNLPAAE
jgi:uncharacterized protein (TIGR02246 family)